MASPLPRTVIAKSGPAGRPCSLTSLSTSSSGLQHVFNGIRADCLPADPDPVDLQLLADYCRSVAKYRNYVHEGVMGMIELGGRRYLPKSASLESYRQWSKLRDAPIADFEPVQDILALNFAALTTLLESQWRMLLDRTPALLSSPGYRKSLLPQDNAQNIVRQRIVLSSNVQLG